MNDTTKGALLVGCCAGMAYMALQMGVMLLRDAYVARRRPETLLLKSQTKFWTPLIFGGLFVGIGLGVVAIGVTVLVLVVP